MSVTLTLPMGVTAIMPSDSTPVSYEVDNQNIIQMTHPDGGHVKITPLAIGVVNLRQPSWAHGQDVAVTVVSSTGTASASGLTPVYGVYTGGATQSVTVGEVPSGRPAINAGTAGGHTPISSGRP